MRYRFADEALAEYIAAGQYYNQKVPGLGDAFADAIEDAIRKIRATPLVWRVVEDDVRRFLIEGFPYGNSRRRLRFDLGGEASATRSGLLAGTACCA